MRTTDCDPKAQRHPICGAARIFSTALLAASLLATPQAAAAADDEPGLEHLDKAVELKVAARSLTDLGKVIDLAKQALSKGLTKENQAFAKQVLSSTHYERAARLCGPIFERSPPAPQWPQLRRLALSDLAAAVGYEEKMGDAHYLIARLESLPGGNSTRAVKAVKRAIELLADSRDELSKALTLRGQLTGSPQERLADFNRAIEIDPRNLDARRARGLLRLDADKFQQAIDDFAYVVNKDPENLLARQALVEAHTALKQYKEALKHADAAIKLRPESAMNYTLRARVRVLQGDLKASLADLNKAVEANRRDPAARLLRARVLHASGKTKEAIADVEEVLRGRPNLPEAIRLRSMIRAAGGDFEKALTDINRLMKARPDDTELKLQAASYYQAAKQPRRAIEIYSGILKDDAKNAEALRGRGDAYLSVGQHARAIKDFNQALKLAPENPGLLNNLAWVLATSPKEKLRDGKRAIELAKQACELTKYKQPHILSTLAAAYAETGDFETAKKWSSKAVAEGDPEVRQQLEQELESYKKKKPWRELQNVEDEKKRAPGDAL